MKALLARLFTGDSVRRIARTAGVTFVTTFVPGALGWLHDVSSWATSSGQHPLPAFTNLTYLLVAATVAAFAAAGNALLIVVENLLGRGFLRTPAPAPAPQVRRRRPRRPRRR